MYNIYPRTYYNYPHLLAPPSLRTSNLPSTRPQRYLNPALWDAVTLGNKTAEAQLQAYMWQTESTCNPTRTFTPDSVTTYDYDYDNRLTTVNLPTNSDTVEYTYDATGRRLTKEFTYHNGANTDVTTYKYHYIGSQITEIEIDAIRNPGEGQSVLRNEEVIIHLGANSQPISYEWVKHVGENTTSATYYYHYDIHGNVLKVTDSSENTKITYTYDTLGSILTETNPDSILNFFTFRGASQTIWEPETGLYYSGGYYRPDTGTALQGTGAPVLTNPASSAMLNAIAEANNANAQLAMQAMISASTAGSSSGGKPGGFAPPSGSSDGMSKAGRQRTSPDPTPAPPRSVCVSDSNIGGSGGLGNAPTSPVMVKVDENGNISMIGDFGARDVYAYVGNEKDKETGLVHEVWDWRPVGHNVEEDSDISDYYTKFESSCISIDPVTPAAEEVDQTATGGEDGGSSESNGGVIVDPGENRVCEAGDDVGWSTNGDDYVRIAIKFFSLEDSPDDDPQRGKRREERWTRWKNRNNGTEGLVHKVLTHVFGTNMYDDTSSMVILHGTLGYSICMADRLLSNHFLGTLSTKDDLIFSINDLMFKYYDFLRRNGKLPKFTFGGPGGQEFATWLETLGDETIKQMEEWILSELLRLGILTKDLPGGGGGGFRDDISLIMNAGGVNPINMKERIQPSPRRFGNSTWSW